MMTVRRRFRFTLRTILLFVIPPVALLTFTGHRIYRVYQQATTISYRVGLAADEMVEISTAKWLPISDVDHLLRTHVAFAESMEFSSKLVIVRYADASSEDLVELVAIAEDAGFGTVQSRDVAWTNGSTPKRDAAPTSPDSRFHRRP